MKLIATGSKIIKDAWSVSMYDAAVQINGSRFVQPVEITHEARMSYAHVYGVDPEDQIIIEKFMNEWIVPIGEPQPIESTHVTEWCDNNRYEARWV